MTPPASRVSGWRRRRPAAVVAMSVAVVAAALVLAWWFWWPGLGSSSRADVVLIIIDTLRADRLGCYGDRDASTPVIDGLAASGVRFANSVAHVPLTLPSHASILTGTTPLVHGVRNNADFVLGTTLPTIAEHFRAAGYHPAAFVAGYPVHRRFGLDRGFEWYDDRFPRGDNPALLPYVERRADATVAATIAWLEQHVHGDEPPVFLWIHLFDPHAPYDPPEPYASKFKDQPYDGEVSFADAQIGVLLQALDRLRPGRRTIIAVTSDHGESLGEHGEPTHGLFVYESTISVPLIIAGPGVPAGRAAASLARGIDVAPTLAELAGLRPLARAEGRSLVPAWQESARDIDEPAYVESLFGRLSFGWAPLYGWRERHVMFVDAPSPELYDLTADPAQTTNLASARPSAVARYRRAVAAAVAQGAPLEPTSTPRDALERLRSLGYVGGGAIPNPSLRDPKDLAATAVRIEHAMANERTKPAWAIDEFRAVLKEDPANPLARRHLAIALAADRRFEEAVGELKQLIAAGNANAEALVLMADCYRLSGRPADAVTAAREAARFDPHLPEAPNAEAKALVALNRHDEALHAFERAVAIVADDPDALAGLADLAIARNDLTEARSRLEALRQRDPRDTGVLLKLGAVLVRMGEAEAAIQHLSLAASIDRSNVNALVNLAGALAKAGRPGEAVPYFEQAVAAGAVSPVVLNGLAFARLESGDRAGAASALRRSLASQPNQPDIAAVLKQIEKR